MYVFMYLYTDNQTQKSLKKPTRCLRLETLKNFILNEKFYPWMIKIRVFFSKLRHFFPIFKKGQGMSLPSPKVK